jgi:hypothetical protein
MANLDRNSDRGGSDCLQTLPPGPKHVRTRNGCWNCKRRRKKCEPQARNPSPTALILQTLLEKGVLLIDGDKVMSDARHVPIVAGGAKLANGASNSCFDPKTCKLRPAEMHRFGMNRTSVPLGQYRHVILLICDRISADRPCQIFDVTQEVIRDYWNDMATIHGMDEADDGDERVDHRMQPMMDFAAPYAATPSTGSPPNPVPDSGDSFIMSSIAREMVPLPEVTCDEATTASTMADSQLSGDRGPLQSYALTQAVAAQLLTLGQSAPAASATPQHSPSNQADGILSSSGTDLLSSTTGASPIQVLDDGIFMPGTSYLALHSALRSHLFDTSRSVLPTRCTSPEATGLANSGSRARVPRYSVPEASCMQRVLPLSTRATFVELSQEEEFELWTNWTDEISSWVRILLRKNNTDTDLNPCSSTSSTMIAISNAHYHY